MCMCAKLDSLNRTTTEQHILLLIRTSANATILALLFFSCKSAKDQDTEIFVEKKEM